MPALACGMDDALVVSRFEKSIKKFVVARLSDAYDDWWMSGVTSTLRQHAEARHKATKTLNKVLGKPDYGRADYLGFDAYGKIILRRDNWRRVFGPIFHDKPVFQHKMRIILSLRNDVMHNKPLDPINRLRLRLHCYDIALLMADAGDEAGPARPGPAIRRRRAALQQKYGLYELVLAGERHGAGPPPSAPPGRG